MQKVVVVCALGALLFTGCANKTGTGALTGGILGAGAGAGIGAAVSGGTGAAIGAGAGAVGGALIGGLIGSALDEQDRKTMEHNAPHTLNKIDRREALSIYDIKQMSHAGLSSEVIIAQIHATDSHFYLSSADIVDLKNAGVADDVITTLIESGGKH